MRRRRWGRATEAQLSSTKVEASLPAGTSAPSAAGAAPAASAARARSEALVAALLAGSAAERPDCQSGLDARGPRAAPSGHRRAAPGHQREGHACFPVMTDDEVAPLKVSAHAPAEQLCAVLAEHGVCLVTDCLTSQECRLMEDLWSEDLKHLLPEAKDAPKRVAQQVAQVHREGCSRWPSAWDSVLGFKGMASQRGVPHGAFAWAARLHPVVRQVFASLYGSNDLCVGVDNVFWAASDAAAEASNKQWLHVDQNHCSGMTWQCVQGALYVWPSEGDGASTTVVWPGSHRDVYDLLMQDPQAHEGRSSVRLSDLQDSTSREALLSRALRCCRRVPCPAGSLLLWDSRIVHQGWSGGPRLAVPVCWEPRARRARAALRRKRWMCIAGVPSTHSAAEGRIHAMLKRRPVPLEGSKEGPAVRASLVPFGVAPGSEDAWAAAQDDVWRAENSRGSNVRSSADLVDDRLLTELLRKEVAGAL